MFSMAATWWCHNHIRWQIYFHPKFWFILKIFRIYNISFSQTTSKLQSFEILKTKMCLNLYGCNLMMSWYANLINDFNPITDLVILNNFLRQYTFISNYFKVIAFWNLDIKMVCFLEKTQTFKRLTLKRNMKMVGFIENCWWCIWSF